MLARERASHLETKAKIQKLSTCVPMMGCSTVTLEEEEEEALLLGQKLGRE